MLLPPTCLKHREIGRGRGISEGNADDRLRNTLRISQPRLNYTIYYQEQNYNMLNGISLSIPFTHLSLRMKISSKYKANR